jgi:hypothetical protein
MMTETATHESPSNKDNHDNNIMIKKWKATKVSNSMLSTMNEGSGSTSSISFTPFAFSTKKSSTSTLDNANFSETSNSVAVNNQYHNKLQRSEQALRKSELLSSPISLSARNIHDKPDEDVLNGHATPPVPFPAHLQDIVQSSQQHLASVSTNATLSSKSSKFASSNTHSTNVHSSKSVPKSSLLSFKANATNASTDTTVDGEFTATPLNDRETKSHFSSQVNSTKLKSKKTSKYTLS